MKKKVTAKHDKQKNAIEYLRKHPNKLLNNLANHIKGGWGPLDPNPWGFHEQ
jgi:hypothetical protein